MSGRFDPKPGEPYARCNDCDFIAVTKQEISAHSSETMKPTGETIGVTAEGHGYRVTNPTREEAISREVRREANDALESAVSEFVETIYRLHDREGVSLAELTAAVRAVWADADFAEAWAEYIADEEDEDESAEDDGPGPQLHQETALFEVAQ